VIITTHSERNTVAIQILGSTKAFGLLKAPNMQRKNRTSSMKRPALPSSFFLSSL